MAKVILVDDEATMVQIVEEMLRAEGHEVHPFTQINPALEAVTELKPDLVVTDLYTDKTRAGGLEILEKARSQNPPITVIMVTGFGSIETAVKAMKEGAFDYIEKPFKMDELRMCIQRALSFNQAITENIYLKKQLKKKYQFDQIIGRSAEMQAVFKMIEKVADTDTTILILGESGTGKELVAKALHFNSRRQFAPFIPVNCSALPENLLESELFGHRKGSFTGAFTTRPACSRRPAAALFSLMRSGRCRPCCRAASCVCFRKRKCGAWATTTRSLWMSGSSRPPMSLWRR